MELRIIICFVLLGLVLLAAGILQVRYLLREVRSGRLSRSWITIPFAIIVLFVFLLVGLWEIKRNKFERLRANWKSEALLQLSELSFTNQIVSGELERLKKDVSDIKEREWVGEHILLMANGEFLVFKFRHGSSGFIDHLFLGHGSDGQWLYSTYHFCNGMAGVRAEEPPESIAEFAKRYSAREFDGKSDECLKHTWPPKR